MKKIKLLIWMLICLFSLNGLSMEVIEALQRERKQNRNSFLNHAHQITTCAEEVQKLSVQANTISENFSKNTKTCGDFISTQDDYNHCKRDLSKIRTYLRGLKNNVANTKNNCPLFSVNDKQLSSSSTALKSSIRRLSDEGMGFWLRFNRESNSSIYANSKYQNCASDISGTSYPIGFFSTGAFTCRYESDIYGLEKSLVGLRIYSDYSQAIAEACGVYEVNEDQTALMQEINEIKTENEQTQKRISEAIDKYHDYINEIKTENEKIQKIISEDIDRYSNYSFDELSSKKCEEIQKRNINAFGLCDNPINTPSWKYSIHHIYKNYMETL